MIWFLYTWITMTTVTTMTTSGRKWGFSDIRCWTARNLKGTGIYTKLTV